MTMATHNNQIVYGRRGRKMVQMDKRTRKQMNEETNKQMDEGMNE